MVDNLLLYNGPSQDQTNTRIVTMNETDKQLRFDMILRDETTGDTHHAIILRALPYRLDYIYFYGDESMSYLPENILQILGNNILDSSAHKVYRKAIFRYLRKYTEVDSFKTLVAPEKALVESMYPMVKQIPLNSYDTLGIFKTTKYKEYLQCFRQDSAQRMTMKLFGKKRYRKDLVKALAGANSVEFLAFMFSLKREIPVDWFINILRNNPTLSSIPVGFSYRNLKEFYDSMSDKQFRKFCKCLMEEEFVPLQSIIDTAEQFRECLLDDHNELDPVTNIKFRSIEEFHYMVGKYHENTAKERERRELIKKHGGPIEGNEFYDQLKNIDFSGAPYEVVIPKYAYEIVEWGKEMSNCIGGYATRARTSKNEVFLALKDKKSDTMKANILISNKNISQFFAKRNGSVNSDIAFDFNMRLILAGFIDNGAHLFGQHFNNIQQTTGVNDLREIVEDYRRVGTDMNTYIDLRKI